MLVYGAVAAVVVWLGAVPWMVVRAVLGRLVPGEWHERLCGTAGTAIPAGSLVIHAVSAGEMVAARALVTALVSRDPDRTIVLTTGTADGRAMADRLRAGVPQVIAVMYLPWDRPRVMHRWLGRLRPTAVVVVETELWPGLFTACRDAGLPLCVVSGRLRPRDVARYRQLGRWWRGIMTIPTRVLAQDAAQADAYVAIGVPPDRVVTAGNLKFDAVRVSISSRDDAAFAIVAGSTHAPEERWVLEAVARLQRAGIRCALTIAPRDVRRAQTVRSLAATYGATQVSVLDRMGTLSEAYAAAHVAICGGTFTPVGGHNLIEPAAAGCALVMGPHVAHVQGLADSLLASNGAVAVAASGAPGTALCDVITRLHQDRAACDALGRRAAAWCAAQQGVADHAAAVIAGLSQCSTSVTCDSKSN